MEIRMASTKLIMFFTIITISQIRETKQFYKQISGGFNLMRLIILKFEYKTVFIVLLLLFSIYLIGCGNTKVVVNKVDKQMVKDGVYYALPQTVITVNMEIKKTEHKKGKFNQCAKIFLELTPNEREKIEQDKDSASVSISEKATISSIGVPDPNHIYMVELDGGFLKKQDMQLALTEAGLITDITATNIDQSIALITKTLQVGASIASSLVSPITQTSGIKDPCEPIRKELNRISETKRILISGENKTPIDAGSLKIMLENLETEKKEQLALVLGNNLITTWQLTFRITPAKSGDYELFSINKKCKVQLANDHRNIPTHKSFRSDDTKCLQTASSYFVQVDKPPLNSMSETVKKFKFESSKEKQGIRYLIPSYTDVKLVQKIDNNLTIVALSNLPIAQLGTDVALPTETGPTKTGYVIKFYTDTGAIQTIGSNSETINPETIGTLGTSTDELVGSIRERNKQKKDAKKTELEKKQEILAEKKVELETLQTDKAIDELQNPIPTTSP